MTPDPIIVPDIATAPHPPYDQAPYPVFPPTPVADDEAEDLNGKVSPPDPSRESVIPPP